jgi:hypothetical protein
MYKVVFQLVDLVDGSVVVASDVLLHHFCHPKMPLVRGIRGHEAVSIGQLYIIFGILHFQLLSRKVAIEYISTSEFPPA